MRLPSVHLAMSGWRNEQLLFEREVQLRAIEILGLRRMISHMTRGDRADSSIAVRKKNQRRAWRRSRLKKHAQLLPPSFSVCLRMLIATWVCRSVRNTNVQPERAIGETNQKPTRCLCQGHGIRSLEEGVLAVDTPIRNVSGDPKFAAELAI